MTDATERRDDVLRSMIVTHGRWSDIALSHLRVLAPGSEMTGERIRLHLGEQGVPDPAHHNAWGALIMTAVRRGMLEATGEYRSMETAKSHARKTPVYRRAGQVNPRPRTRVQPVA